MKRVTFALTVALASPCLLQIAVTPAACQDGRNVLVVTNAANQDSERIGEYYARARLVPAENLLRLDGLPPDPPDGIDRPVFERAIQRPVATWLARNRAHDRIYFIVLTKGIPLRINGGQQGTTAASVDSELALVYRRLLDVPVPLAGPLPNPYFLGSGEIAQAKPFSREEFDFYLVTRLDGYTVQDVLGLIDRAVKPSPEGRFIVDGKSSWTDKGNVWLRTAAERLKAAGLGPDRIVADESETVVSDQVDVLGYYSWGSNDPAIKRRSFNLKFRPGAIGGMFVSTDGRTFREPPVDWQIGNWADRSAWFAGTPQSLAGDLIREGITGVSGHVSEPLLGHTVRPDILFPAYVAGFSLAEAFYLAMPSLSWQTVVVGDPLCRPFTSAAGMPTADPGIDPQTELPAVYSRRRLKVLAAVGVPTAALEPLARAEGRVHRGEAAAAIEDYEHVLTLAPGLEPAQQPLARLYESARNYDAAIALYRRMLENSPTDVLTLNNLAYGLSIRKQVPSEALPFAERAKKLAPRSGEVTDTLGWIHHLLGDQQKALALLTEAAKYRPNMAEIRWHLAQVHDALGNNAAAKSEIELALKLAPSLAADAAVKRIQEK